MRPRKLALKGFTCFRAETEINFEDMDVFAITGRTGSGKTTIMDAICYALYGQVPRGTDTGQLVAQNADKMYVSLEFEAGNGRYRAARTMNVSAKGARTAKVQLERRIDGDDWEPLEDKALKMNAAVEEIVGLDFHAFKRCVLLPQGQFQAMLTGTREDRRKVLEDLLDITIYERIMVRANAVGRDLKAQARAAEDLIASTYAGATEEALQACRTELAAARPAFKIEQERRAAVDHSLQHATRVVQARKNAAEARELLAAKTKGIAAAETLAQDGAVELDRMSKEAQKTATALHDLAYDLPRHLALNGALGAAQNAAKAVANAEKARVTAADTAALASAEHAARVAAASHDDATAAVAEADRLLKDAQRADAAMHVRAGLKAGDACPVCGGTIGRLPKGGGDMRKRPQAALNAAQAAEKKAGAAAEQARVALAGATSAAERAAKDLEVAEIELKEARSELAKQLPKDAPEDVPSLKAVLAKTEALAKDFDRLTKAVATLNDQRAQHERAIADSVSALQRLHGEAAALTAASESHTKDGDKAIAELRAIVDQWKWTSVAGEIDASKNPTPVLTSMQSATQSECDRLTRQIGKLEEREKAIARDIQEAAVQREALESLRAQANSYTALGDLLQANRFREWYIGTAMEMLADAASARLQSLDTDARFTLGADGGAFTVKDAWQGGEVRSPETLSGGETFVVSLALALALAEQLPQIQQSSAAVLNSLFLDEGFGALDTDTLDPVVNALQTLGAEGRMVGMITHVGEMAERIGTRIEVTKSPEGSTVRVLTA